MRSVQGDRRDLLRDDGELMLLRAAREPKTAPHLIATPSGDPASASASVRLEREFALRDHLDPAWSAMPLELRHLLGGLELRLSDPGGVCLTALLLDQTWEPRRFFPIAIALAQALGALHARGLIHRDIRPANLLVDPDLATLALTGFGLAIEAERAMTPCEEMVGALAYLSPEQTGRFHRGVDVRSDLYSCGVVFYQLLCGALPFAPANAMEAVHCHLARQAVSPRERCARLPALLSDLVMKLLAKAPEDRYQSTAGLLADLRSVQRLLEKSPDPQAFVLGREDQSARLQVPTQLYGRDHELSALHEAYRRAATSGRAQCVLVSGYSGVGKSSLVASLRGTLDAAGCRFAAGKFDQFKRDVPYASLAGALQSLVRSMLGCTEEKLAAFRSELLNVVGAHGQLLTVLVPELERVIGSQPAVAELPAVDAQRRFLRVLRGFLSLFATARHPLVLFLDDLQWLDRGTLELLGELLDGPSPGHLLLIGAYRDNEVGPGHPLTRTLQRLRASPVPVLELSLPPLDVEALSSLIAETLRCELRRALPLAHLVHERTQGNPFFAIQFLSLIADEGLIRFDAAQAAWTWDPRRIAAKSSTDNVVGLMVERLARLPTPTQELLRRFACLGNQVSMRTLDYAHGPGEQALHDTMWSAVQSGLVIPLDDGYAFLHDRVQEAAYALIPTKERARAHLQLARQLADRVPREQLEDRAFEIAGQFNQGATELHDAEEALRAADINRLAGHRARLSGAYASAQTYFAAGLALLPAQALDTHYTLAFDLGFRLAQCEFLTGQSGPAGERLVALSSAARGRVDQAALCCLRIDLYTSLRRSDLAVEVSLDYLRQMGIVWSAHPSRAEADAEFAQLENELGTRRIEALIDLPRMTDPEAQATLDVLTSVQPPALFTDENLHSLVVARMARLSLEKGNSDGSCYAYAVLGVVLGANFDDYERGFRFG